MKLFNKLSATAFALLTSTNFAFAHHPLGGKTPATFMEGLLSGVGHPIIGLDHLLFIIAVGVAAFLIGARLTLPLFFIIATVAGTVLHLNAIDLPIVEVVIALSVAAIGFLVMSGRAIAMPVYAGLFAVAGLFHGHAYGEAIFGAEATPMIAYLGGFAVVQYLVALLAGYFAVNVFGKSKGAFEHASARLTGGMVAGAGVLLVGEHAISAIFG
ncbi:MAG: HupE/UreJ family protein [Nitratireductor sp.]